MTDLTALLEQLRGCRWVDLTHPFAPGTPRYHEFPDEERRKLFDYPDGFLVHEYRHIGQWGTHVDPPSHFIAGGRSLDQLPVTEMILPLAVLDARAHVEADPDFAAGAELVEAHEREHGPVPERAFVALRTAWSERWPDQDAVSNGGHTPGWHVSALELLVERRGIAAIGHETTDTDPSATIAGGSIPAETYILERDRWQIEALAGLDGVPERGALMVAAWPKPAGGSGFPARCFAIVP
ncbi:MAG TPA: cyclase family protein [Thermoleophilaceae bacterium]|nr:cyclase family protein [Thermoleophilaceae bacterium]